MKTHVLWLVTGLFVGLVLYPLVANGLGLMGYSWQGAAPSDEYLLVLATIALVVATVYVARYGRLLAEESAQARLAEHLPIMLIRPTWKAWPAGFELEIRNVGRGSALELQLKVGFRCPKRGEASGGWEIERLTEDNQLASGEEIRVPIVFGELHQVGPRDDYYRGGPAERELLVVLLCQDIFGNNHDMKCLFPVGSKYGSRDLQFWEPEQVFEEDASTYRRMADLGIGAPRWEENFPPFNEIDEDSPSSAAG